MTYAVARGILGRMDDDTYEAELDAAEERHAAREAERALAAPEASEARTARLAAAREAAAQAALLSVPLDPRAVAIERATYEATPATGQRHVRIQAAYELYGAQRSPREIVALIVQRFGVSVATAQDDLRAVRDITESWRHLPSWHERRDQHMMGLRALYDRALAFGELETARKIMGDMRAVEGFNAPTKGMILHGHGALDTTLPDGPGVVGGVALRKLPPDDLRALQRLLGDGAVGRAIPADTTEDAIDAEVVERPPLDD